MIFLKKCASSVFTKCLSTEDSGPIDPAENHCGDLYGKYGGGEGNEIVICLPINKECEVYSLRFKFIILSLVQPFVTSLLRPCARIHRLCKGDFIKEGTEKAQRIWRFWKIKASVNREKAPNELTRKILVLACILWQLGKELLKIGTLPLAAALLEVVAIGGIFIPRYARVVYAFIERQWSQERIFVEDLIHTKVTNCLTVCMQPKAVWEEQNLFALRKGYDSNTWRSLLNKYENFLVLNRENLNMLQFDIEGRFRFISETRAEFVGRQSRAHLFIGESVELRWMRGHISSSRLIREELIEAGKLSAEASEEEAQKRVNAAKENLRQEMRWIQDKKKALSASFSEVENLLKQYD